MKSIVAGWLVAGLLFSTACTHSPVNGVAKVSDPTAASGVPVENPVSSNLKSRFRPVVGVAGMVVSDDELASEWGAEILRQGGNAVDAAVAAAFMMSVTRPHYAALGGGGFMIRCPPPKGRTPQPCQVLDFREVAPRAATRTMYVRDGKADTALSQIGALASGVPGVPAGLTLALQSYGSTPLKKILTRPIEAARKGVRVSGFTEATAALKWADLNDEAKRIFGCSSGGPEIPTLPCMPGATLKQPDLAQTLVAMSRTGGKSFFRYKSSCMNGCSIV